MSEQNPVFGDPQSGRVPTQSELDRLNAGVGDHRANPDSGIDLSKIPPTPRIAEPLRTMPVKEFDQRQEWTLPVGTGMFDDIIQKGTPIGVIASPTPVRVNHVHRPKNKSMPSAWVEDTAQDPNSTSRNFVVGFLGRYFASVDGVATITTSKKKERERSERRIDH